MIRRSVLHLHFADGVTRDVEVLVCRLATASAVSEANGALVVDGGDVELQRCKHHTHQQQGQRSDRP